MISLSKFKSFILKSGRRILKVEQYGAKTALESMPFGEDSNPLKNMVAIYAETQENSEPVIIGYINEKQIAAKGEKRMYSLKEDGNLSSYIWLKNNSTVEIMGSNDNAVRYQALDDSLQDQKNLINAELTKIQAAISGLGGTYVLLPVEVTTTSAKISEIKTP